MQIVARELRIAHMMFVVPASWFQLGLPEGLVAESEARHGIHAGDIETSMMLKISPDLVFEQDFANFIPSTKRNESMFPILTSMGAAGFGWQAQDLHPKGACGDTREATSEKGEKLISHAADRLAELIAEVASYPLSELRDRDVWENLG
jgi:creatinine amidohydrolase